MFGWAGFQKPFPKQFLKVGAAKKRLQKYCCVDLAFFWHALIPLSAFMWYCLAPAAAQNEAHDPPDPARTLKKNARKTPDESMTFSPLRLAFFWHSFCPLKALLRYYLDP